MSNLKIYIIIAALLAAALGYGLYQKDRADKLQEKLAKTEQNLLAASDTLHVVKKEKGELASKMAFIVDDFTKEVEKLRNVIQKKDITIISQVETIVQLRRQLSEGSGPVYGDSAKAVYPFKDTLSFYKYDGNVELSLKTKKGIHTLKIWTDPIPIKMTIYQDEENRLYGSVESLSDSVKVVSAETKINSKYVPPLTSTNIYNSIWERLGLYGSVNINGFNSIEGGIVVRPFTIGYETSQKYIRIGINETFRELFKDIF